MNKKKILVFGATGKQGGAVVKALLGTKFMICAATRNPEQTKAKALVEQGVEIIKADFNDEKSLCRAIRGVYGVFSVHNMVGDAKAEEKHSKLLATLSKRAGVQHFVYSSVGGAERKSGIEHFDSKWRVEEFIRSIKLPYTIIRPVFFMENFIGFPPFIMFSLLRSSLKSKTLQMIAVEDIGKWAETVFSNPDQYLSNQIEIAGDELSYSEIQMMWQKIKGKRQFSLHFPKFIISLMGEAGKMFLWFGKEGYRANIKRCKVKLESSLSFEKWLASQQ